MKDVTVRRATTRDAAMLADLAARTFVETFGAQNNPADLELYLRTAYSPEIQRAELEDPTVTYLIAEVDGSVAGFAMIGAGRTPDSVPYESAVEVMRFYVDHPWHGSGIARVLMDATVREAERRGAAAIWLGVWEKNPRAIRFYEKQGFRDVGAKTFTVGTDVQHDRVMARPLQDVSAVAEPAM